AAAGLRAVAHVAGGVAASAAAGRQAEGCRRDRHQLGLEHVGHCHESPRNVGSVATGVAWTTPRRRRPDEVDAHLTPHSRRSYKREPSKSAPAPAGWGLGATKATITRMFRARSCRAGAIGRLRERAA